MHGKRRRWLLALATGGAIGLGVAVALLVLGGGDDRGAAGGGDVVAADSAAVASLVQLVPGALPDDPRRAALLARTVMDLAPSPTAELAMVDVAAEHAGVDRVIAAHQGGVEAVARTSHAIVSAGRDARMAVWDPATGALLAERDGERVLRLGASERFDQVASCDANGRIAVWSLVDPARPLEVEMRRADGARERCPVLLAFAERGAQLLALWRDGAMRRWDAATGTALGGGGLRDASGIEAVAGRRGALAVLDASLRADEHSGEEKLLVVTAAGGVARVELDELRAEVLVDDDADAVASPTSVASESTWSSSAAVGTAAGLATWNDGLSQMQRSGGGAVADVAFGDGSLAVASDAGVGRTPSEEPAWSPVSGRGRPATALAGGGEGFVAAHADGSITQLGEPEAGIGLAPGNAVTGVMAFGPDGDLLVADGTDPNHVSQLVTLRLGEPGQDQYGYEVKHRTVRTYRPARDWWPQSDDETEAWYVNALLMRDGLVVAAGQDPTGTAVVLVWDADSGRPLVRLPMTTGGSTVEGPAVVTSVELLPERGLLVAYGNVQEALILWSTEDWRQLAISDVGPTGGFAASPDESTVAVVGLADEQSGASAGLARSRLQLFDVERREVVEEHPLRSVYRVAFAPDGHALATLEDGGVLRIRSPDGGRELRRPIPLDSSYAFELAWRPDSKLIAVSLEGSGVVLVDPATGNRSSVLPGSADGRPLGLAWSPDGSLLAATNTDESDTSIITEPTIWTLGAAHLRRRMCEIAATDWTAGEWRRWIGPAAARRPVCPPAEPDAAAPARVLADPVVAYQRRDRLYAADADGKSRLLGTADPDLFDPVPFAWAPSGALAWASEGQAFRLEPGDETPSSWPCQCDRAAFDGETLVALESDGSALLRMRPGAERPARQETPGLPRYSPRLLAATGGEAVVVGFPTEPDRATEAVLHAVGRDGATEPIGGTTGHVIRPGAVGDDGQVAFVVGWSSGACYSSSAVGLVDLGRRKITHRPEIVGDEVQVVRSFRWDGDGRLSAVIAPIGCDDDSGMPPTDEPLGEVHDLRGGRFVPTGESIHDVQRGAGVTASIVGPVPAASRVGTLVLEHEGERVTVAEDVRAFEVRP